MLLFPGNTRFLHKKLGREEQMKEDICGVCVWVNENLQFHVLHTHMALNAPPVFFFAAFRFGEYCAPAFDDNEWCLCQWYKVSFV